MRDHNKAFCQLMAEAFDCPGPIYEIGSYQVEGQESYADLRQFFPGKPYLGCDMRPGPGVDLVEDVSRLNLRDNSAGTILCIETFEHVFEVDRAFDEVYRVLRPGGLLLITMPLNFKLHGYPDDYWRMTPSCLRRKLTPYAGRMVGYQGYAPFPHTVMGLAVKHPLPPDFNMRAETLRRHYNAWLRLTEQALSVTDRLRRGVSQIYRSKGERRQVADYYRASFTIDAVVSASLGLEKAG